MATVRVTTFPATPTPLAGDTVLYVERDTGGGVYVSEKTTVVELLASSWETKTANYTAVNGDEVFADTTSAALTITLPATPSVNDKVSIADYAGTYSTNALTVARNGVNIMGLAEDMVIDIDNVSVDFIYSGVTQGWRMV